MTPENRMHHILKSSEMSQFLQTLQILLIVFASSTSAVAVSSSFQSHPITSNTSKPISFPNAGSHRHEANTTTTSATIDRISNNHNNQINQNTQNSNIRNSRKIQSDWEIKPSQLLYQFSTPFNSNPTFDGSAVGTGQSLNQGQGYNQSRNNAIRQVQAYNHLQNPGPQQQQHQQLPKRQSYQVNPPYPALNPSMLPPIPSQSQNLGTYLPPRKTFGPPEPLKHEPVYSRPMGPPLELYMRPPPTLASYPSNQQYRQQLYQQPQGYGPVLQQQSQTSPQPPWNAVQPQRPYISTTTTGINHVPSLTGPSTGPGPAGTPGTQQMSYHSNQVDKDPDREITFLIHKPGDETIIQNTILEDAKHTGQNVEFIKGPNLKLTQQQKVYLPPKPKTIVYIMLTEPQVETNVEVMGQNGEDKSQEEPEVYVVYQKSNQQRKTMHHGHHHQDDGSHYEEGYSQDPRSTSFSSSSIPLKVNNSATTSGIVTGPSEYSIPILSSTKPDGNDNLQQHEYLQGSSSNNHNHYQIFGKSVKKEYGVPVGIQKLSSVIKKDVGNPTGDEGGGGDPTTKERSRSFSKPIPSASTFSSRSVEGLSTTTKEYKLLPICRTGT